MFATAFGPTLADAAVKADSTTEVRCMAALRCIQRKANHS